MSPPGRGPGAAPVAGTVKEADVTRSGIPLPEELAARARDVLSGKTQPVIPRHAATVVLLRDARDGDGVEAYLLRRAASMAFAPGAYVFPGGSVDPRDADHEVAWAGPPPQEWGRVLNTTPSIARALVCAAVRETFEESGVLLAGPSGDSIVDDTCGDDWEADRRALLDRSLSLAELLDRRGLVLRSDLLGAWAQWVTPVFEPRRFDTRFFVAELPAGQRTRDVGGEADRVMWVRPADAIAAARRGEIFLMPPTAVTLAELSAYDDVAACLAAVPGRTITVRLPGVQIVDGAAYLTVPEGLEYPL